jgi:hypothetical protein
VLGMYVACGSAQYEIVKPILLAPRTRAESYYGSVLGRRPRPPLSNIHILSLSLSLGIKQSTWNCLPVRSISSSRRTLPRAQFFMMCGSPSAHSFSRTGRTKGLASYLV